MILDGKTLIVSGVGPGLGGEIARLALRDGANVMLGARREASLKQIARELDPSGKRVAWRATDITDAEQCQALADAAAERFGGVDGLVQVAALDAVFGTFEQAKPDDFRNTLEVNVIGTLHMVRVVVPHLRKRGGGSIVLIGSQASFKRITPQIAYAASKGALHTAMYFMASELGKDHIRVNHVIPTWMWGPPVEAYIKGMAKQRNVSVDTVIAEVTADMPIPEIPADEDVAEAVIFLSSDRSRFITGQDLFVNSGQLMR